MYFRIIGNRPWIERGAHDEPLRRGADVGERIAGHQRQCGIVGRVEHRHVRRLHDVGALHVVVVNAIRGDDANLVIGIDVAQLAEEGVAMPRKADVPLLAGQRGAGNVSDGQPQRTRIAPRANDRGDAEPRNLDAADRRSRRGRRSPRRVRFGRCRVRCGRRALQDCVELLILERLIETRLAVRVEEISEAQHAEGNQNPFEPASQAAPASSPLDERTVEVLDEAETSPTPCSHCGP